MNPNNLSNEESIAINDSNKLDKGIQEKSFKTFKSRYIRLTRLFKVIHQKVNIDINISKKKIEGYTEIKIIPTNKCLKVVKINCHDIKIKEVFVNQHSTNSYIYNNNVFSRHKDFFEEKIDSKKFRIFDMFKNNFSVNQHHVFRNLDYMYNEVKNETNDGQLEEIDIGFENLVIALSDAPVRDITSESETNINEKDEIIKNKENQNDKFLPIDIRIDFVTVNPRSGVNFINNIDSDKRFCHVYTLNTEYNTSTSSWVPCIDDITEKCTWTIELSVPKTIKDIEETNSISTEDHQYENKNNILLDSYIIFDESELVKDDDIENPELVVCCGEMSNIKETLHSSDPKKKIVSWSIYTPISPHHVGWALGCFKPFVFKNDYNETDDDLQEMNSSDEMEKELKFSSFKVYCFSEQFELIKSTFFYVNNALNFFLKKFGAFPFNSMTVIFVKYSAFEYSNFAGLCILNESLLIPSNVIEPMFINTELLLDCLAFQWCGIHIVFQSFDDLWCVVGIRRFIVWQYIKKLMGNNEFRFRIKKLMEMIIDENMDLSPLASYFFRFPVSELDLSFIKLKSLVVLYILDKRMIKTNKSFGLLKVIQKIFLQVISGDLQNGCLSSKYFQHVCEKVSHNKFELFFKQWIYGIGLPHFRITQKYNRKKSLIEMSIHQIQNLKTKVYFPNKKNFVNDSIKHIRKKIIFSDNSFFSGSITIRIHEADGSLYEHIVDLKESHTKIEIQFNSKLKKKKIKDDLNDSGTKFSKLGDVLESPSDILKWGFKEWVRDQDDILFQDPFEWLRVDADFEWITKIDINQPDYMFASQLQYDMDVEAHYDAVIFFGNIEKPNINHCTILTRTIMDDRYYYGVRIAAAESLAKFSKPFNDYIGVKYLINVFKELFCYSKSSILLCNNFNNFKNFFLLKSIPLILSNVKNDKGYVPEFIKKFLFNLIRYNDNSQNQFLDCYFVSNLLKSLTNCFINKNNSYINKLFLKTKNSNSNSKEEIFYTKFLEILDRYHKLDEWIPSYKNIISITCIQQKIKLTLNGFSCISIEDLLYYTLDSYSINIRIEAFLGIFILGGLKNTNILRYFFYTYFFNNQNPYFKTKLINAFFNSICIAAIDGIPLNIDDSEFISEKSDNYNKVNIKNTSNMVIIDDDSNSKFVSKINKNLKKTIENVIKSLRLNYAIGKGLQKVFWYFIHLTLLSIYEKRELYCMCEILFEKIDSFTVTLPISAFSTSDINKKLCLKYRGNGLVVIKKEGRFKIQLASRKLIMKNSNNGQEKTKKNVLLTNSYCINESKSNLNLSLKPQKKLIIKNQVPDPKIEKIEPQPNNLISIKLRNKTQSTTSKSPTLQTTKIGKSFITINNLTIKFSFKGTYKSNFKNLFE